MKPYSINRWGSGAQVWTPSISAGGAECIGFVDRRGGILHRFLAVANWPDKERPLGRRSTIPRAAALVYQAWIDRTSEGSKK